MGQVEQTIRRKLTDAFSPQQLDVVDDSSRHAGHAGAREGGHFTVDLVSKAFSGRPQLERHKLVYAAVAPLMGRGVHALSIRAHSPEEIS